MTFQCINLKMQRALEQESRVYFCLIAESLSMQDLES